MHSNFGQRDHYGHHRHYAPPHRQHTSRAGKLLAIGALLLLSTWAGTATLYILFRDDALRVIASRQVQLSHNYDSQVVSLKAEIERLKSLKLVDQERVDRAVAELSRRQAVLETRQTALNTLASGKAGILARDASPEITGSIPSSSAPAVLPANSGKPIPLSDTILLSPPVERRSQLESRPVPPLASRMETEIETAHEVRITNLSRALEKIETEQGRALNQAEEAVDLLERRMRNVFADLGMKPPSGGSWFGAASVGGPFLPFSRAPEDPFARQLQRVRTAVTAVETLSQGLSTLPVRRPLSTVTDVTSGFGTRVDPFVRQLAMHTGVDFRSEPGEFVRATAVGKVTEAGRNGGYGLMVEVDHGNGLVTRYAHLSAIEVSEGAIVKPGQIVGRVGTTGRSTGPHLHYEVRLNGEAIDPQKYLRAGLRLLETM